MKNSTIVVQIRVQAGLFAFARESERQIRKEIEIVWFFGQILVSFQTVPVLLYKSLKKFFHEYYFSKENDSYHVTKSW